MLRIFCIDTSGKQDTLVRPRILRC